MPHIHDLIDFSVDAFIVHQQRVLLIFHKKHNMWLQVGGHVELHENPEEALFREVKEECGLDIEIIGKKEPNFEQKGTTFLYPPTYMNIHDINETHKHIALIYFAKAKSSEFVHNKEEHNDIRWFTQQDLENPEFALTEAVKFYAKEALRRAG